MDVTTHLVLLVSYLLLYRNMCATRTHNNIKAYNCHVAGFFFFILSSSSFFFFLFSFKHLCGFLRLKFSVRFIALSLRATRIVRCLCRFWCHRHGMSVLLLYGYFIRFINCALEMEMETRLIAAVCVTFHKMIAEDDYGMTAMRRNGWFAYST